MTKYKGVFVHEITSDDIRSRFITLQGCPTCGCKGKTIWISNFMGPILPCDVGKRIYEISRNVYQVENDEQLNRRITAEAENAY